MPNFEMCNFMTFDVCLFLEPKSWTRVSNTHRCIREQLQLDDMQQLFECQQQMRLDKAPRTGITELADLVGNDAASEEKVETDSRLSPVLDMARTLEAATQVIADSCAHPYLLQASLPPVQEALSKLQDLFQTQSQLRPQIREAYAAPTRMPIAKKLVRFLGGFSGLLFQLTDLLKVFSVNKLPRELFIATCDVLVSLLQWGKDKNAFVQAGGLDAVLLFLRKFPRDAELQASGVGALVALSAMSESSIRLMVSKGCLGIIAKALQQFRSHTQVATRCTGLLANLSNVNQVCPLLMKSGVIEHVKAVEIDVNDKGTGKTFVRFVHVLFGNLEMC